MHIIIFKYYGRQIYAFNPHKMVKCHIYICRNFLNNLQEMLSNPHEFFAEVGSVVCFGR